MLCKRRENAYLNRSRCPNLPPQGPWATCTWPRIPSNLCDLSAVARSTDADHPPYSHCRVAPQNILRHFRNCVLAGQVTADLQPRHDRLFSESEFKCDTDGKMVRRIAAACHWIRHHLTVKRPKCQRCSISPQHPVNVTRVGLA